MASMRCGTTRLTRNSSKKYESSARPVFFGSVCGKRMPPQRKRLPGRERQMLPSWLGSGGTMRCPRRWATAPSPRPRASLPAWSGSASRSGQAGPCRPCSPPGRIRGAGQGWDYDGMANRLAEAYRKAALDNRALLPAVPNWRGLGRRETPSRGAPASVPHRRTAAAIQERPGVPFWPAGGYARLTNGGKPAMIGVPSEERRTGMRFETMGMMAMHMCGMCSFCRSHRLAGSSR